MTCRVRPSFYRDIADQELWLLDHASHEIADRWHDALWETIGFLAQHPLIGRERRDLKRTGVRSWRIEGFERWLILYGVRDDAIILYRVVSGTMDLKGLRFA
jgi:plasmid stabilization system protein ParE